MQNEYLLAENREKRAKKQTDRIWFRRFIIAYVICIAVYLIYVFAVQGVSIHYVGNIQKAYAKFLVESNDEFVEMMVEFEVLTQKTEAVYTNEEKERIRNNLNRQNEFLKKMQESAPNDKNSDYLDLYQDMLQIYAFYIQGEIMKAEYCYKYDDNYTLENTFSDKLASKEQYTMGQELCNMMGNMILNNYRYINQIRNTSYSSKYNIQEMGGDNGVTKPGETPNTTPNESPSTTPDTTPDEPSEEVVPETPENEGSDAETPETPENNNGEQSSEGDNL